MERGRRHTSKQNTKGVKLTLSKISLISPVSSELGSMMFIANFLFPMSRSGMDSAPVGENEHK